MKSLILLSGGIDSAVCSLIAKRKKRDLYGLTFNYNQKHKIEIKYAKKISKKLGFKKHWIIKIPNEIFLSSSLVNLEMEVPEGVLKRKEIPSTYVPCRNLIFLSIASAIAETNDIDEIYIGVNTIDFSGYPDCRKEFINSFIKTLKIGTKRGVEGRPLKIFTPLIDKSKKEIIELGKNLGLDFSLTWSCYNPKGSEPCFKCDSCILRKKAFEEAKIIDPLYKT